MAGLCALCNVNEDSDYFSHKSQAFLGPQGDLIYYEFHLINYVPVIYDIST